jgi:two-component system heavy metal sensor histidine kinase CusS
LAQAENATDDVNYVPVDLVTQARKIAEYLETFSEKRNIVIAVGGDGKVFGKPGLVQRAIINLLSNAVRHGRKDSKVHVVVEDNNTDTSLIVENLGNPIHPDHLSKLFNRFYRVDASRSQDAGGTGLGLAIVKAIMLLHGGNAVVDSSRDGTTRFTLVFPKRPQH